MPGKRWPAAAAAAAVALVARLARLARLALLALLALATGCYRGSSPPPEAPGPARPIAREPEPATPRRPRPAQRPAPEPSLMAQVIEKLTEVTDAMCACTDQTCADAVVQEMRRWSTEMGKNFGEQEPTAEETREATAITERLSRCMVKAMGASSQGSPTPP